MKLEKALGLHSMDAPHILWNGIQRTFLNLSATMKCLFQPLEIHSELLRWHLHQSRTKVKECQLFANHFLIHVRHKWTDFRDIFFQQKTFASRICLRLSNRGQYNLLICGWTNRSWLIYLPRMAWLRKSAPRNCLFWWEKSYLKIQNNKKINGFLSRCLNISNLYVYQFYLLKIRNN